MTPVVGSPPWTPEEDVRLRKLALRTSVAAMAKQMYRSMAAVRNRAARLKIMVAKSHNQGKEQRQTDEQAEAFAMQIEDKYKFSSDSAGKFAKTARR